VSVIQASLRGSVIYSLLFNGLKTDKC